MPGGELIFLVLDADLGYLCTPVQLLLRHEKSKSDIYHTIPHKHALARLCHWSGDTQNEYPIMIMDYGF